MSRIIADGNAPANVLGDTHVGLPVFQVETGDGASQQFLKGKRNRMWRQQQLKCPQIAARQATLSITNSRSSPRLTSIESVTPPASLSLVGDESVHSQLALLWPRHLPRIPRLSEAPWEVP